MAFQISPGVNTSEIDLTTVVPGVSSVDAGFSGAFRWGPINEVTLVDSEDLLTQRFQKPDANTFVSFFTAANFLQYSNRLHLVRCATSAARNASGGTTAVLVANSSVFYNTYDEGGSGVDANHGDFMAKFAGDLGNSLKVSICGPTRANLASGNTVVASNSDITLSGTIAVHASDGSVTGTASLFAVECRVGDVIQTNNGNTFVISGITSNTAMTVNRDPVTGAISAGATAVRFKRSPFSEPSRNMTGTVAVTANSTTVSATTATARNASGGTTAV